jgi:hypothetical protein
VPTLGTALLRFIINLSSKATCHCQTSCCFLGVQRHQIGNRHAGARFARNTQKKLPPSGIILRVPVVSAAWMLGVIIMVAMLPFSMILLVM